MKPLLCPSDALRPVPFDAAGFYDFKRLNGLKQYADNRIIGNPLRCVGKLIEVFFICENGDRAHIKFGMFFGVSHHLTVRKQKTIFPVITDRMAHHSLPKNGAKLTVICMVMFRRLPQCCNITDSHYDTFGIINKGNLFSIRNHKRLSRKNILIKCLENSSLITGILHPVCIERQNRLVLLMIVNAAALCQPINILLIVVFIQHCPAKRSCRE